MALHSLVAPCDSLPKRCLRPINLPVVVQEEEVAAAVALDVDACLLDYLCPCRLLVGDDFVALVVAVEFVVVE